MDGVPGIGEGSGGGLIEPGKSYTYEFDASPFGLHLYHCHVMPLESHISKGLYGAFIIDPRRGRPKADELVMVMNGFDTNFDGSNEVYAVNTVGFHYMDEPVRVRRGELVRIYLVNTLEFDPINSFHIHANFFHYYPTGTSLEPTELTDTVVQAQGQRGILELRFPKPGRYMFHAHVSEFAQLGWMGFFEVERLMEARAGAERPPFAARAPAWALGLIPLSLIAGAAVLLALVGAPGLGDRTGPPVEELAVERTVLRPGEIELTVRNDGPDAVDVAQVVGQRRLRPVHRQRRPARRQARGDHARHHLPMDRGRGVRDLPAHLHRRHHRARDPRRDRDSRVRLGLLRR